MSPRGATFEFGYQIAPTSTNNRAEYQVVLKGLQLLHEVKAESIEIFGDSQLVIGLYECKDEIFRGYYDECKKLLDQFLLASF
jgi:ribonuclease HI